MQCNSIDIIFHTGEKTILNYRKGDFILDMSWWRPWMDDTMHLLEKNKLVISQE